jgi:hypothetical protein
VGPSASLGSTFTSGSASTPVVAGTTSANADEVSRALADASNARRKVESVEQKLVTARAAVKRAQLDEKVHAKEAAAAAKRSIARAKTEAIKREQLR